MLLTIIIVIIVKVEEFFNVYLKENQINMTKNFNERSFTLFTINYIVGFGFISTIISLIQLNLFGIIAIVATAFITFGAALVFSRLTNNFKNEYGGSYAYTKKLNNNNFSFFVG